MPHASWYSLPVRGQLGVGGERHEARRSRTIRCHQRDRNCLLIPQISLDVSREIMKVVLGTATSPAAALSLLKMHGTADYNRDLRFDFPANREFTPHRLSMQRSSKVAQTSCSSKSVAFSEDEPQSFSKSKLCAASLVVSSQA